MGTSTPLERLRLNCAAFPEATERLTHGVPTWYVRDNQVFVTPWAAGHQVDQFPHL